MAGAGGADRSGEAARAGGDAASEARRPGRGVGARLAALREAALGAGGTRPGGAISPEDAAASAFFDEALTGLDAPGVRAAVATIGVGAPYPRGPLRDDAGYFQARLLAASLGSDSALYVAARTIGADGEEAVSARLITGEDCARLSTAGGAALFGPAPARAAFGLEAAAARVRAPHAGEAALTAIAAAADGLAPVDAAQTSGAGRAAMLRAVRGGLAALCGAPGREAAEALLYRRAAVDPAQSGALALVAGRTAAAAGRSGPLAFDARSGALRHLDGQPVDGPWIVIGIEALASLPGAAGSPLLARAWEALAEAARTGLSDRAPATRGEMENLFWAYQRAAASDASLAAGDRERLTAAARRMWSELSPSLFSAESAAQDDRVAPRPWPSHAELAVDALTPRRSAGRARRVGPPPAPADGRDAVAAALAGPDRGAIDAALDDLRMAAALQQATAGELGPAEAAIADSLDALTAAGGDAGVIEEAEALRAAGLETAAIARRAAAAALRVEQSAASADLSRTETLLARALGWARASGDQAEVARCLRLWARLETARMRLALATGAEDDGAAVLLGGAGDAKAAEAAALRALDAYEAIGATSGDLARFDDPAMVSDAVEILSLMALAARRGVGRVDRRRVRALAKETLAAAQSGTRRGAADPAAFEREAAAGVAHLALEQPSEAVGAFARFIAAARGSAAAREALSAALARMEQFWAEEPGAESILRRLRLAVLATPGAAARAPAAAARDARDHAMGRLVEAPAESGGWLFGAKAPAAPRLHEPAGGPARRVLARAERVGRVFWGGRALGVGVAIPSEAVSPRVRDRFGPWLFLTSAHLTSPRPPADIAAAPPEEISVVFEMSLGADGAPRRALGARAAWTAPVHGGHDVVALVLDVWPESGEDEMSVSDAPPAITEAPGPSVALVDWTEGAAGAALLTITPARVIDHDADPSAASSSVDPVSLTYRALGPVGPSGAPIFSLETGDLIGLDLVGAGDRLGERLGEAATAGLGLRRGVWLPPALRAMRRDLDDAASVAAPAAAAAPIDAAGPALPASALREPAALDDLAAAAAAFEAGEDPAIHPMAAEVSTDAVTLILETTVGGRRRYERRLARPFWPGGVWPGDGSGLLIGVNYDLGRAGYDMVAADWSGALDEVSVTLLKTAAGATAQSAGAPVMRRLAKALGAIEVPWEAATHVFTTRQLPRLVAATARAFGPLQDLHPHSVGALVSLVAVRGSDVDPVDPERQEMAEIARLIRQGQPERAAAVIRSMKRQGAAKGSRAMVARREREAALFERGAALVAAGPGAAPRRSASAPLAEHPRAPMVSRSSLTAREAEDGLEHLSDEDAPSPPNTPSLDPNEAASPRLRWLAAGAPSPQPAGEEADPDLQHISGTVLETAAYDAPSAIALTGELLSRALKLSGVDPYSLAARNPRVLFGLRGAALEPGEDVAERAAFVDAVRMREQTIDYRRMRCVIGVWDVESGGLWAAPGSTVPSAPLIYDRARRVAAGADPDTTRFCNLLPTGMYRYRVGTHGATRGYQQPGAFLFDMPQAVVLRCDQIDPMNFTTRSRWDIAPGRVANDIHAGGFAGRPELDFLSAGGQTLRGRYEDGQPTDAFGLFRLMAGLAHPVSPGDDGVRFSYALLTARELRIAAATPAGDETDPALQTLRLGASGPRVSALQRLLGAPAAAVDGVFDMRTQAALIARQHEIGGFASGVVGPKLARQMGLDDDR